jgi:hypothetical protein
MWVQRLAAVSAALASVFSAPTAAETGDGMSVSSPSPRAELRTSAGTFYLQGYTSWQHDTFFRTTDPRSAAFEAYSSAGARVGFVAPGDRWEISLWSRNWADEGYDNVLLNAVDPGSREGFPSAPRSHGVTVILWID